MANEPGTYPCGRCACSADGRHEEGLGWRIYAPGNPEPVVRTEICPRRLVTARSAYFIGLYLHYKRGVLPVAGGLLDQPAAYIAAMTTLEQWLSDA